jgi:hypothetical protein
MRFGRGFLLRLSTLELNEEFDVTEVILLGIEGLDCGGGNNVC